MVNKLPLGFKMNKYGIDVRFVEESDAEFILSLRTDPKLSRYLHATDNDVEKQRQWIRKYKEREAHGKEYYFMYIKNENKLGVSRIYNIEEKSFTVGSWIFSPGLSYELPFLSSIITKEIAFDILALEFEVCNDGVHINNQKVLKANKMMGMKETGRIIDNGETFITMSLEKEDFKKTKTKMLRLLNYEN